MAGELITRSKPFYNETSGTTHQLTVSDSDGVFTNSGASAQVTYKLPDICPVGLKFTFIVRTAQVLQVSLSNKTGITFEGSSSVNDGFHSNAIGDTCVIVCVDGSSGSEEFVVVSTTGSGWSFAAIGG